LLQSPNLYLRKSDSLSCNRNGDRFGATAAEKSGISAVASKAGNTIGTAASKIDVTGRAVESTVKSGVQSSRDTVQSGWAATKSNLNDTRGRALKAFVGQPASTALKVVNNFDMPKSINALSPLAAIGALLGGRNTRLMVLNSVATVQVGRAVTIGAGTGAARLSRDSRAGPVKQRNYSERPQIRMRMYASRLSPALNAADIRGWPVSPRRSLGVMAESQGQSWHMGVTTVETPQGEQRSICHLQSLNWPGTHYYFNRALKDEEVAVITSNHPAFPEPKHMKGYLGEVTEVESLAPTIAHIKHQLIRASAFFGENPEPNQKG
jgi:hypothetical protein